MRITHFLYISPVTPYAMLLVGFFLLLPLVPNTCGLVEYVAKAAIAAGELSPSACLIAAVWFAQPWPLKFIASLVPAGLLSPQNGTKNTEMTTQTSKQTTRAPSAPRMTQPLEMKTKTYVYDVDKLNGYDAWALFEACALGCLPKVKALLAKDRRLVNAQYWYQFPIHMAVFTGNAEIVKLLLEHGADPGQSVYTYNRNQPSQQTAPTLWLSKICHRWR